MLEEVMRYIDNRFDRDEHGRYYGVVEGEFAIDGGVLEIDGLLDGQYFWLEGSAMNDGLHQWPATDLADEVFSGRVVFLRVPPSVSALASEIEAWNSANSEVINSPYQSESFGGYSYAKASGGSQGNEPPAAAWQVQFGARLRPFRKLSRDWV